jgi:large subunit ribosomal protein L4
MELKVYNIKGEDTGRQVSLSDSIFGVEPNDHAIYLDVKQFMANNRQGTHKAKERGEISGSTRKLKKQKGTGSARFGSIKNPIFRGGGRIFGPRPKDYSFKLNKKLKVVARKSALTYKVQSEDIFVVEDFKFDGPKTKQYKEIIDNLKIGDKKSLLVLAESNKNIYLSSRNLQGSKTVTISELTTYDIINAKALIFAESSIDALQKTF